MQVKSNSNHVIQNSLSQESKLRLSSPTINNMKAKKPLIIKKVCDIKGRTPTQTASITSRIQEIASTYAKNKLIFMQKQQEKNTTMCKDINDFLMQRKSSQGDPRSISRE
jgi:hypothetical protein